MPVIPLGRWALGWSIAALGVSACGESRSPGATPSPVPGAPVASITQISIAQASLAGGQSTEGTVTLSGPAPSGVSVTLSSSHPTVVVPRSVSVAAGATSATFPITTQAVTTMTEVSITATLGSSTQTTVLRVNLRGPTIVSLSVDPSVAGGQALSATIEIDTAAPDGGVAVALSSDNDAGTRPRNSHRAGRCDARNVVHPNARRIVRGASHHHREPQRRVAVGGDTDPSGRSAGAHRAAKCDRRKRGERNDSPGWSSPIRRCGSDAIQQQCDRGRAQLRAGTGRREQRDVYDLHQRRDSVVLRADHRDLRRREPCGHVGSPASVMSRLRRV